MNYRKQQVTSRELSICVDECVNLALLDSEKQGWALRWFKQEWKTRESSGKGIDEEFLRFGLWLVTCEQKAFLTGRAYWIRLFIRQCGPSVRYALKFICH